MTGKSVVLLAAAAAGHAGPAASAQELKPWKHGVIEPKGDAGFTLMVGPRGFAEKHGLKLEIVTLKNGATAHKALLAGEIDSIESSPGRRHPRRRAWRRHQDPRLRLAGRAARADGALDDRKVEDLKGKTIAVAAPGSLPNLLINALLEKYKIPRTTSASPISVATSTATRRWSPASPMPASWPPNSWRSRPRT